jgi:hypothetical protein
MNRKQILVGLIALFVGLTVYLVDRPPEQTYFIYKIDSAISLHHVLPPLFGPLGKILPAFVHVFSFALLTAGILACKRKGCVLACLVWLSVDVAFELGQKFGVWSSSLVPSWFEGIPLLENTVNYFTFGTFDFMDLTAIAVGSLAAYITMMCTLERRVLS